MVHKELLQDETLAKKLITKGFWVYFFAFFSAPIGYILRMFLSNTVSVSEVGVFYSVLGLMGLISSYNDLGLTEAMQYFIPKFWIKGEKAKVRLVIFVSFFMQLLMGILIFFLLYSGADWLALHHFHDPLATQILKILAFYFFGLNIITLCSTMFVSFQDTFSQGLVSAIQQVVNLVFTVVFWATASLTVVSYAWVWIIGVVTAIVTGVSIVALKYREVFKREQKESYSLFSITTGFSKEGKSTLKQHFKYALRVFLVANVASLLGQVDQQVVVNVLWPESAGLFSNFQALLMVFILVVTPLFWLLFPLTTELITKKDTQKFWLLQRVMYTYFWAFALMVSGFFVVFGQEIAVFLFGEGFRFSGYMLQWVAPALIFNCWAVISLNILAGLGKIKQRLGVVASALAVNLILNLIFLILLGRGLIFSAMILSVSRMVMALGAMWVIGKSYPFSLDWKFLLKNVLVIGGLMVVLQFVKPFFVMEQRREIFRVLLVLFVGYGIVLAGMNRRQIRLLWREIKSLSSSPAENLPVS